MRFVLLAAVFTLAHTLLPLYSSTQNTYLLHGLASAGLGKLSGDWLVHTADPFPVFTLLVRLTAKHLPAFVFYIEQAALFGVYLFALLGLASTTLGIRTTSRTGWALATALIALHSGLLGKASEVVLRLNAPRLFEHGLANQYLLGYVFQPCNFGVLLLVALAAAARARYVLAIVLAATATALHPSYMPTSAFLSLTVAGVAWRRGAGPRHALGLALLTLALAAPVVAYVAVTFPPGPANAEAARILANVRLPHHAVVSQWWGTGSVFQLLLMAAGLTCARGTPLFPFLLWPALASTGMTLVQLATGSAQISLMFPWRFSVVLVPVSTTLLLGWLLLWLRARVPRTARRSRVATAGIAVALALLAAIGVAGTTYRFRTARDPGVRALEDHVRTVGRAEDLYLVPTEMEGFRLAAGVPVLVDRKNHPFRASEVIEWYARVRLADDVYWTQDSSALGELLDRYPVTMVVARPGDTMLRRSDRLEAVGEAGGFRLLRVARRGPAPGPATPRP